MKMEGGPFQAHDRLATTAAYLNVAVCDGEMANSPDAMSVGGQGKPPLNSVQEVPLRILARLLVNDHSVPVEPTYRQRTPKILNEMVPVAMAYRIPVTAFGNMPSTLTILILQGRLRANIDSASVHSDHASSLIWPSVPPSLSIDAIDLSNSPESVTWHLTSIPSPE